MKTKLGVAIILFLAGLMWFWNQPASTALAQQVIPSPTPGPDGRILYIVQNGDTCEGIAAMFNVTLEYLKTTNQLNENCDLRAGQFLLLGIGGPSVASPTPGASPTPSLPTPTATPSTGGTAIVCVLVYDDLSGDGLRQESEAAIAGAALSLTNADGSYSKTTTTVINSDPTAYQGMCFDAVPAGEYTVSAAAPAGYNPTIGMTSTLKVVPGDTAYVDFGAQVQEAATPGEVKGASPLLGILGALLLLVALGLGIFMWQIMRKK